MTGQCSLRGIYFIFSPPAQRQKKPHPTKQHICKPLQANLNSKFAKELFFANPLINISAAFLVCCHFIDFFIIFVFKNKTIATDKLNIEGLKKEFKDVQSLKTNDIIKFYRINEPELKTTTINWRIYALVQMGVLTRIGRGKFSLGNSKIFIPEITSKLKTINSKLKKEFPFLDICLWNTSSFNEFMVHQPGRFYILIEVEKDATQSVFFFLKEAKHSVFINPTKDIIEKYLPDEKETLIVKPLITEAPIQKIEGLITTTLEKMLVDVFCDDVILSAQQGSEMRTIFQESMNKYTVNENRMIRYADRRRKKETILNYLGSISNLRQQ